MHCYVLVCNPMPEETHPDDDTDATVPEYVADAADKFDDHPHVEEVERDTSRFPTRLCLTLADASISRGIEELIDETNARIVYADCASGTDDGRTQQYIEVVVDEPYKPASRMNVRRQNPSSLAVTIPREARELSGITEGDEVEFTARDGEIRMTARE